MDGKKPEYYKHSIFLTTSRRIFIITRPLKLNERGTAKEMTESICGRDPFSSEEKLLVTRPLHSPLMYATVNISLCCMVQGNWYSVLRSFQPVPAPFLVLKQKKLYNKQQETEHFM
jgi:hypothetical protein